MKKILFVITIFANALLSPAQMVSTLAGSGAIGSADSTGIAASFWMPTGVCRDVVGNLYVADQYNHKIRKITHTAFVMC